jgi:hypothetical protein
MRNLVIAVIAVGALTGCGAVHERSQTASMRAADPQLAADQAQCRQQSVGATEKKIATFGQTMNREAYDDCMRARGYDVDAASAAVRR